ncbi:beta-ketoacyl-ACP synthase 3 [Eubacteriales bacterium KG127]
MKFIGFGKASGDRKVTNDYLAEIMDTSDDWIHEKTGIKSRWFAENKTNADMAFEACQKALHDARLKNINEIDALIVCTFTPDKATPTVSNEVCERLSLKENILSIDLNGACSGFIYGCSVAEGLLRTTKYNKIIVVGSEKISQVMPLKNRNTDILFGDGAGAVVCTLNDTGFFESEHGLIGTDKPLSCPRFEPQISMQGQEVYRFATSKVPEITKCILEKNHMSVNDIDWFVFHQANKRIIESSANKLGISLDKCYVNIEEFGNTSAASIPIALADMQEKSLLKKGMKVACVGFGAGLTYGAMICQI